MMNKRIQGTVLAVALLAAAVAEAAGPSSYQLTLTKDPVKLTASESFSCSEKTYAFLRLPVKVVGKHNLEGKWYKPDGELQEHTKATLTLPTPGQDLFHLWLEFEQPGDAVDVLFTTLDNDEYDGVWTLDVYWDSKRVGTKKFQLNCI